MALIKIVNGTTECGGDLRRDIWAWSFGGELRRDVWAWRFGEDFRRDVRARCFWRYFRRDVWTLPFRENRYLRGDVCILPAGDTCTLLIESVVDILLFGGSANTSLVESVINTLRVRGGAYTLRVTAVEGATAEAPSFVQHQAIFWARTQGTGNGDVPNGHGKRSRGSHNAD